MPETFACVRSRWSASILLAVALGAAIAALPTPAGAQADKPAAAGELRWAIPLFEQAFIWGVGPRVAEAGDGRIPGFSYSAPFEDLKLK
jgi:hypothetical protein